MKSRKKKLIERIDRIEKTLSLLINDVWNLHLNGRMTDSGDIWNRYKRIANVLEGKSESEGFIEGFLTELEKKLIVV